jgi:subtilase family serine protease
LRIRSTIVILLMVSLVIVVIPLGARIIVSPPPQRVVLPGHLVSALKGTHPLGATPSQQILSLSVGLKLRNQSALTALLKAQDTRTSGLFHHYLTPQTFAADFGPLPADTQKVATYLASAGFHITSVATNHALIFVTGTVATSEHTFAITLDDYLYHGQRVFAPLNEPSVPADLATVINGIGGLDDIGAIHHTHAQKPIGRHPTTGTTVSTSCPIVGYGPSDWRSLYDIAPLVNNGYDGTGQNIAIVEFDGATTTDLTTFSSCYKKMRKAPVFQAGDGSIVAAATRPWCLISSVVVWYPVH